LTLKRGNAFELIQKYNLFDTVRDKVMLLFKYDKEKAIQMLVSNPDKIPVNTVVKQLEGDRRLLHEYLHSLFTRDPHIGKDFHELQISLYAEFDYKFLMTFLRQTNYFHPEKAYNICKEHSYYPEMVYILGRMGSNKQALQLLIEKIADVKEAIDFIEAQKDEELWEDLISYSMKNAKFVSSLLEHIGAYVDPVKLIKRIPEGMQIEHLRDRLVKIIFDYNLQMSLREGCKEVLKADCVDLAQRLNRSRRRGLKVEEESKCPICAQNIISARPLEDIVIFYCRHIYHRICLSNGEPEVVATNATNSSSLKPTTTSTEDFATTSSNGTRISNDISAPTILSSRSSATTTIEKYGNVESLFCTICMSQGKRIRECSKDFNVATSLPFQLSSVSSSSSLTTAVPQQSASSSFASSLVSGVSRKLGFFG